MRQKKESPLEWKTVKLTLSGPSYNSSNSRRNEQGTALVSNNISKSIICVICAHNHYNNRCDNPNQLKAYHIKSILVAKNCCIRCLNPGHASDSCTRKSFCYACKSKDHHKLSCSPAQRRSEEGDDPTDSRTKTNNLMLNNADTNNTEDY